MKHSKNITYLWNQVALKTHIFFHKHFYIFPQANEYLKTINIKRNASRVPVVPLLILKSQFVSVLQLLILKSHYVSA